MINHTTGSRYENVVVCEENNGVNAGNDMDVSSPDNLSMAVYSILSGELMWERAPSSTNVTQYEILRNGNVVGTTDGTSWFEGNTP